MNNLPLITQFILTGLGGFLIGLAAGVLVRTRGRAGRSTRALWLLLVPIVLTLGVAALP